MFSSAGAITFSGTHTSSTVSALAFTDGTNIYIQSASTVYSKYSVSGSTLTFVSNITFTNISATNQPWCDGTNIYGLNASGTVGISKWALTGGAASATYSGAFNAGMMTCGATNFGFNNFGSVVGYNSNYLMFISPTVGANSADNGSTNFLNATPVFIPKF